MIKKKGPSSKYIPSPIQTKDVTLPKELLELVEILAENNHDVWALQRIKEGWTYGKYRDDIRKTNPCLIPYNKLPESEKEYDRMSAIGTIKLLIKLGYRLEKVDTLPLPNL